MFILVPNFFVLRSVHSVCVCVFYLFLNHIKIFTFFQNINKVSGIYSQSFGPKSNKMGERNVYVCFAFQFFDIKNFTRGKIIFL